MKYSFALAALCAVVSMDSASAIHMSAEPVMKKEEPKKDEAAIKAKFDAVKAKADAQAETAKDTETKKMNADEAEVDRSKAAYQTAYWGHMKDQADETQRIKDLRQVPAESKPMEGHVKGEATSAGEHWVSNMPDHILDNKKGPSAPFDSPKPKATAGDDTDAAKDEEKADAKKKTEAAAVGAKSADSAKKAEAAPVAAAEAAAAPAEGAAAAAAPAAAAAAAPAAPAAPVAA